jgi:hypothetical protein
LENKRKIIFCDPLTSNIEAGEYSYVQEAGGKAKLEKKLGIQYHILNWISDLS